MNQKSMARALRRHHVARLKRNRRFYHGYDLTENPRYIGQAVHTPANCSCWMCGNPRKFFGEPTMQEKRQYQALADDTCENAE